MRTKDEIERSLAEMKGMADDARRGLAKTKEMNATVLVKYFEQWETKCEARAQILSWVLGEQELSEDVQPQLPQADVIRSVRVPKIGFALLFAWYDMWVGFFWDKKKKWLYVFPVPMFGFILKFGRTDV